jgi:hypothetical protein
MSKQSIMSLFLTSGLLFSSSMVFANDKSEKVEINDKAIAVQALTDMSTYLRSLEKFIVLARSNTDEVLENGQKIQLSKTTIVKAAPPSKLWAKTYSMYVDKEFFFDSETFTIYSPNTGFYASFKAPKTIGKTLTKAKQNYDVNLPLRDLFYWGTNEESLSNIDEALIVGVDTVNGISCNQFAFREKEIDWQICIQRGNTPLPLKLVITSKLEPAQPQYMAILKWDTAPTLTNQSYTFKPRSTDKKINFAKVKSNK